MYYPYLRGRQNEMLCLKELLDFGLLSDMIVPIIEPVRFNSTFFNALSSFIEKKRDLILIQNPKVGSFEKDKIKMGKAIESEDNIEKKKKRNRVFDSYIDSLSNEIITKALIMDKDSIETIEKGGSFVHDLVAINTSIGNYSFYEDKGDSLRAKLTLIPQDDDFKEEVKGDTVVLHDGFDKKRRNADYLKEEDEFFGKNHITYKRRNYAGFSDYSIVGDNFEEEGFAPAAIAIHIMYFGSKDALRIHHFVSDSNESYSDLAMKFDEAMQKLLNWELLEFVPKTRGLELLIDCHRKGKFPGLGIIKRYSLMHHLQMIGDYLERVQ